MFSYRWSAIALPRTLSDRRARISSCPPRRGCAQVSARLAVAVLCAQVLGSCASRPIEPASAAVNVPLRSTSIPQERPVVRQAQSRPDCQFKVRGLGDTWIDADGATPTSCITHGRRAGTSNRDLPASSTK
jgi:hypothetical protein